MTISCTPAEAADLINALRNQPHPLHIDGKEVAAISFTIGQIWRIVKLWGRSRVPRKRYAVRLHMHPDHRITALLRLSGARISASPPGCTKVSGEGLILLIM